MTGSSWGVLTLQIGFRYIPQALCPQWCIIYKEVFEDFGYLIWCCQFSWFGIASGLSLHVTRSVIVWWKRLCLKLYCFVPADWERKQKFCRHGEVIMWDPWTTKKFENLWCNTILLGRKVWNEWIFYVFLGEFFLKNLECTMVYSL